MRHTWKKGITLAKMGHNFKNGSLLEKWVTLGKMVHTWKNGSYLEKTGSHLEK